VGIRQRLLETPADRISPELARTVTDFCDGIDVIKAAYVGIVELTRDFDHPVEHLAVGFALAEPASQTAEGDRELRLVADRFYDTMPADLQDGGCNFLEPGGVSAWQEKAQLVFSR
jgi:hypothetical protein